ncbi:phage baseplate assembly protein V [Pseudomonas gingeri]|uniref:phage baseplate assembly protein V n=1 Tax=Pseudomonas gingeri TaxID=117681 RepID=UPI0015A3C1FE|nr:phage baseplate assembly protein V [Pseudomonas gingeri]NWD70770.1 phage baseplate assembly protein V [Pseudomonas gingeri]
MNDLATLARLLENLIRFGTVADVQMKPPRVRVKTGELTTGWLPWLAHRAGADKEWNPPTLNEQVLLFSPSGQLGNGVALTGLFSDDQPANGDRDGLHRRTYRDGAVIEYDSIAHHLSAVLPESGTTDLISKGGIHIIGPITHDGDYTHQGNTTHTGYYTQTGNQDITGTITASTDVIAADKSLVGHAHTGNLGAPTSPPL